MLEFKISAKKGALAEIIKLADYNEVEIKRIEQYNDSSDLVDLRLFIYKENLVMNVNKFAKNINENNLIESLQIV